jgi:hypothetical protein
MRGSGSRGAQTPPSGGFGCCNTSELLTDGTTRSAHAGGSWQARQWAHDEEPCRLIVGLAGGPRVDSTTTHIFSSDLQMLACHAPALLSLINNDLNVKAANNVSCSSGITERTGRTDDGAREVWRFRLGYLTVV